MRKKLIIFQNKQLFNILKEIKQIFEFDLDAAENEIELKNDPSNHLMNYAMASNISGVIGSAVAAGVLISYFS